VKPEMGDAPVPERDFVALGGEPYSRAGKPAAGPGQFWKLENKRIDRYLSRARRGEQLRRVEALVSGKASSVAPP
jgi:hypothetical protein